MIDQNLVRKYLDYNPQTGELFWKKNNSKAFTAINNDGYKQGSLLNKQYKAHRIIWLWYYGVWPDKEIDHINGNPNDNRIENLRDVSKLENKRNVKLQSNNKSGICGVHFDSHLNKWRATIYIKSKRKHLGYFENIEEAITKRKDAEKFYNFHENHGIKR